MTNDYLVQRVSDGSVVEECFVLTPRTDRAARKALMVYAGAVEDLILADEIRKLVRSIEKEEGQTQLAARREIIEFYERTLGVGMTPHIMDEIEDWRGSVEDGVIKYAIREAAERGIRSWKYINAIIRNSFDRGLTTLAAVEGAGKTHKARNGQPDWLYSDDTDFCEIEKLMRERM